MRLRLACLLAALVAAAPGEAQQLPGTGQAPPAADPTIKVFEAYVNSKEYLSRIHGILMQEEQSLTPECKQPKVVGRAGFTVLRPPAFQTGIHPSAGAWQEKVRVDRCGKTILHNVLAMGRPGAEPQIGLLFPGTTAATPPLQRDAIEAAGAEAIVKLGCKDHSVSVLDTALDTFLEPLKADPASGMIVSGKWRETWTLRACKKILPVAVEFTANGKGGATVDATTKVQPAPKPAKK